MHYENMLDNEDFILGAIALHEAIDEEFITEKIASGSYESVDYEWYLVSGESSSRVVLLDAEENGLSWISPVFEGRSKSVVTENLLHWFRQHGHSEKDMSALKIILGDPKNSFINPRFVSKAALKTYF